MLQQESLRHVETRDVFSADFERFVLVYGGLAQDVDQGSRTEYLKGLLHIGADEELTFGITYQ